MHKHKHTPALSLIKRAKVVHDLAAALEDKMKTQTRYIELCEWQIKGEVPVA